MDDKRFSLARLRVLFLRIFGAVPRNAQAAAIDNFERTVRALTQEIDKRQKYNVAIRAELQTLYDERAEVATRSELATRALAASAAIEARNVELAAQLSAIGAVLVTEFRDRCAPGEDVHDAAIRILRDLFRERADFEAWRCGGAEAQIERLAAFILAETTGPIEGEGAGDAAIRIIRDLYGERACFETLANNGGV